MLVKNTYSKGFTLIEILVTIAISVSFLVAIGKYFNESDYKNDATSIAGKTLDMLEGITQWNEGKSDCKSIGTPNIIAGGLAPKEWTISDSSASWLERALTLRYKYGRLIINTNLLPAWLSGTGLNPTQGYAIIFQTYPRDKIPLFISQLMDSFDLIDVGGVIIKDENGINQVLYNNVLNDDVGTTTISLITWGC